LWREHHEIIHRDEKSPKILTVCGKKEYDANRVRAIKTLRRKKENYF
jgi:hypothetical protein